MLTVDIRVLRPIFYLKKWRLKSFCRRVVGMAWTGVDNAEISVVVADDDFVQNLNRDYRGKDCPTNVLSFENPAKPVADQPFLAGDIILAFPTIAREARALGVPFSHHLAHLIIHGTLHLQGYDHLREKQAVQMEKKEIKLMREMGFPNPYGDR